MDDLYRGKPVSEMAREELIAALRHMALLLKSEREEHARELKVVVP